MNAVCKMTGEAATWPCPSPGCPLYGDCMSQTGLADGSVRTLFGVPLDRMRELAQAELAGRIVLRSAGAGKKCGSCGHWHRIKDTRRGTCDVRRWLRDKYGASEPGTAFIPTQSYGACRDYIPREDDNHG